MQPLTIIIDGNYLFYKTLFVSKGYGTMPDGRKYLSNKNEMGVFIRKVATDLVYSLNTFSGYSRIIFTKDSKSWRKQIDIPGKEGYKSGRSYAEDVDWNMFFTLMNEFTEILKEYGVIISTIDTAEGDDLMYLWSDYLNNKENPENVIVFTGDGDLTQITNFNDDVYTAVYVNKAKSKLIVKPGMKEWLKDREEDRNQFDIFSDNALKKIMTNDGIDLIRAVYEKIETEEVDPNYVILSKILCGDDGDDIPSIWEWKKDGKPKRITNRFIGKVYNELMERNNYINIDELVNNPRVRNRVRLTLQEATKVQMPPDIFYEKMKVNALLAHLSKDKIPQNIIDEFNATKDNLLKNKLKKFDNIELLAGTKFEKKETENTNFDSNNTIKVSDIFDMFN